MYEGNAVRILGVVQVRPGKLVLNRLFIYGRRARKKKCLRFFATSFFV